MMKRQNSLFDIFFPPRCGFCGGVVSERYQICNDCLRQLEFVHKPVCSACGREMKYCRCNGKKYGFKRCAAPLYYKGTAAKAMINFKFHNRQSICDSFAKLMSETVADQYRGIRFDLITEVPVHKNALRKKGYNHAQLLAKEVSRLTNIPYEGGVLLKTEENEPQHQMSAVRRKANVFGIFSVGRQNAVSGKRILLCDDIMTTGSTLDECAKILKIAGALEVYCVVGALALPLK